MKIVRVTYTIQPEFSGQNQVNIQKVMAALQQLRHVGINYNCCLGADSRSFTHTAFFESEEDQKVLNELPEFQYFQQQIKTFGFETPPRQELLTLVGSSTNIFGR
jgi:hypothetical protein